MKKHLFALPFVFVMLSSGAALARPFVYIASFAHGQKVTQCLDSAEKALAKYKFTLDIVRDYDPKQSDKVGRVYGSQAESSTKAVILCDQKEGITSLAVSGLDIDVTWDLYTKMFYAEW